MKTSRHQVNSRFKDTPWQLIVGVRGVSPGHRQAPFDTKSPGTHSTATHFRPPHRTRPTRKDDDLPPELRNVCFWRHRANSYLKETPCQLIACPRGISTCHRKPPFDSVSRSPFDDAAVSTRTGTTTALESKTPGSNEVCRLVTAPG